MKRMNFGRGRVSGAAVMVLMLALAGTAQAQRKPQYPIRAADPAPAAQPAAKPGEPKPDEAEPDSEGWMTQTRKKSVEIGSQPARDVGVMKRQIPPILVRAKDDPYSLQGLKTCKQLAAEITELNVVLGADYVAGVETKENKAGKLAEAGGKTVINSIIPFRGLVREVSGAAPADRRMKAAQEAGYARRGFLRGVHANRGCRSTF
jgi:hypothetical protein